jgi:hypothetical protein
MTIRTGRPAALALLGLALAGLALAGCSADSSSQSTSAPAIAPAQDNAKADGGTSGKAADGTGAVPAPPAGGQNSPQLAPQLRSLIYTGTLAVTVPDVAKAADAAGTVATAAGGSIAGDNRTLDADRSQAQLTLRVPSDAFSSTMDKLATTLGTETSRSVSTQDVTQDLVDLDARLATQRASVDRVRALLAKANTVGEVVSIESELTKREADLDSLEQRKTKLSGLVALSTITLNLRAPAAPAPAPVKADSGFLAGLKSGWQAFVSSAKVFLTVAGWLLPWLIVIGLPAWLILRFVRARRRAAPVVEPVPASVFSPMPAPAHLIPAGRRPDSGPAAPPAGTDPE